MQSSLRIIGVLGLALLAGCTTKSAEPPSLSGPSGLALALSIVADKDILSQNGLDEAAITVQALGPNGESRNVNVRAEIRVEGVPQDFGTLSTKSFTTPSVIRYRAPAAATTIGGQVTQTVTIAVAPIGNDIRGEISRTIDINLVPPGTINPINPSLVAGFTVTPLSPMAFQTATFDATTTTNNGSQCTNACTYSWNFGDGTTGTGQITTHVYRTVGNFQVSLTVTDSRGAQTTGIRTITVLPSTPPIAAYQFSPTAPSVNSDVFFNGSESTADRANGRTIARYDWNFGDGSTASGATVTHRFSAAGSYQVTLTVTDDVGATDTETKAIPVTSGNPTATMTITPSPTRVGQPTTFNASGSTSAPGSTIVSYAFNYGDGSPVEVSPVPVQSHVYGGAGTVTATLVVTDSVGRTGSFTIALTINP